MKMHSTGHDSILGHALWYNKSKCLNFHHFQLAEKEEVFCTFFVFERTLADIRQTGINKGADFCKNLYLFGDSTARLITFCCCCCCSCATKLMEKAVTACKHKTLKAVSLFILGKYGLRIPADVVKK